MENNINLAPPYYNTDTLKTYIPFFGKNKYKATVSKPNMKSWPYYLSYVANGFEDPSDQDIETATGILTGNLDRNFNYLDLISRIGGTVPTYIIAATRRNNSRAKAE